jgi:hypothetical protein
VRVNSDKQTLILAGEAIPRRDAANSSANELPFSDAGPRLTMVATRADETMLLAQGDFAHKTNAAADDATSPFFAPTSPYGQSNLVRSVYTPSSRGSSFNAVNEYARTQDRSAHARTMIIDTYA